MTTTPVAAALQQLEIELNSAFLERTEAIRATLLATLAGEHLFIVGPPGTGKSLLVRTFAEAITGSRYFECALSKTRPAEAVLGPLDIKEFRENGNYFLKRAGYASQVEFAFFDEIGKSSPVLGHDLLALLNERVYHEVNGGRSVHKAPLSTAFAASNEMLTDDNDDNAALWDRLLVRTQVDYLQDKANFARLLASGSIEVTTTLEWPALQEAIKNEVPAIRIGEDALTGLVKLRAEFAREHVYPSDRRWKASMKVLRANAYLEGRDEVTEDDMAALRFTLWDTLDHKDKVERLCLSAANPFVDRVFELRGMLNEIGDAIKERAKATSAEQLQYAPEAIKKLTDARNQLDLMLMEAAGRKIPGFKQVSDLHESLLVDLHRDVLGVDEDLIPGAISKRLGQGDGGNV